MGLGKWFRAPVLTAVGLALLGLAGAGFTLFGAQSKTGWALAGVGSVMFLFGRGK